MGMKGLIKVKASVTGTHHGNERVDKGEGHGSMAAQCNGTTSKHPEHILACLVNTKAKHWGYYS